MKQKPKTCALIINHFKTIQPDLIVLKLTDSQLLPNTQEAIARSNHVFSDLLQQIKAIGFDQQALKTLHFETYSKMDYIDNKQVFLGIQYQHEMILKLKKENQQLSNVLEMIQENFESLNFQIDYEISDLSKVKDQLLQEAIGLAIEKADLLCKASHLSRGSILSINTQQDIHEIQESARYGGATLMKSSLAFDEMTPQSQDISVSLNIVFEMISE